MKTKNRQTDPHRIVIEKTAEGKLNVGSIRGVPDITQAEIGEIAAWYLALVQKTRTSFVR